MITKDFVRNRLLGKASFFVGAICIWTQVSTEQMNGDFLDAESKLPLIDDVNQSRLISMPRTSDTR